MKSVVADASIILKWVLPADNEPYQQNALALRDLFVNEEVGIFLPPLWYFEVGNLLGRKFPQSADQLLIELSDLLAETEVRIDDRTQSIILRLAENKRVTFYDASYHAVAIAKSATLFTADEKYLRAVTGEPCVSHIKDFNG